MTLVVDSSVFVAAFREDEPFSREAFSVVERLEAGIITIVIPVSVLIEVVAAIRRRTGSRTFALQVSERLLQSPAMSLIDLSAFRLQHLLAAASQSGLSGMDAIVVAIASEFNVPLVTLDHEMARKASLFVTVKDIREI